MIYAVAAAQLTRLQNFDPAPLMKLPVYVAPGDVDSNTYQSLSLYSLGATVRESPMKSGGQGVLRGTAYALSGPSPTNTEARRAFMRPSGAVMDIVGPGGDTFAIVAGTIGPAHPNLRYDGLYAASLPANYDGLELFYTGLWSWKRHPNDPSGGECGHFYENWLTGDTENFTFSKACIPSAYRPQLLATTDVLVVSDFAPYAFDNQSLLDGLELMCELKSREYPLHAEDCGNTIIVDDPSDLKQVSDYVDCLGKKIERRAAFTVFDGVPVEALDALRRTTPVGTHAAIAGTLGAQYSDLRGALLEIADAAPDVGREVSGLARDIKDLVLTTKINEKQNEIANVQFWSTVANQIANCANSAVSVNGLISFGASTAITCANTIAQIGFASEINRLSQEIGHLQNQQAYNTFNDRFAGRIGNLEDLSSRLTKAVETVDGVLIEIQNTRARAQRIFSEAMWVLSNESKAQATVSTVVAVKKETAKLRYQEAFENAQQMSFLAKGAIEQRLGIRLTDITDDLPLINAPST